MESYCNRKSSSDNSAKGNVSVVRLSPQLSIQLMSWLEKFSNPDESMFILRIHSDRHQIVLSNVPSVPYFQVITDINEAIFAWASKYAGVSPVLEKTHG